MGKYDDFDLDLKQVNRDASNEPRGLVPTLGPVCTFATGVVVGSYLTGCSSDCTKPCTRDCSNGCKVPSRDYNHPSCRK